MGIEYTDVVSGTPLVSACYSVYDRAKGQRSLNGVICVDLNVIIDLRSFKRKPGYEEGWALMRKAATSCTPIQVPEEQLNAFRAMQGGICRSCDFSDENCPTDFDPDEVNAAEALQPGG